MREKYESPARVALHGDFFQGIARNLKAITRPRTAPGVVAPRKMTIFNVLKRFTLLEN